MKPVNFNNIKDFTLITLLSFPAMYTDMRIDRNSIPEGKIMAAAIPPVLNHE